MLMQRPAGGPDRPCQFLRLKRVPLPPNQTASMASADPKPNDSPGEAWGPTPQARGRIKLIGTIASIILFAMSAVVLALLIRELDFAEVRAAFARARNEQLATAAALTALSYIILTGYDFLALRQINARMRYGVTALASFTSYAISFTLGFPLLTGGTVRYWIYAREGMKASSIASLTLIAGVTFWLGMGLVLGIGLIREAEAVASLNRLAVSLNYLAGSAILAAIIGYVIWVSLGPRAIRVQGWTLHLPGLRVTAGQLILGALDVTCAGAVLYVLLPAGHGVSFAAFLAVFVFAVILGIISHAPGGLGVFEATILLALPAESRSALLGSLLVFRLCYYVVPFVFALALLGAREIASHWKRLRNEFESTRDKTEP